MVALAALLVLLAGRVLDHARLLEFTRASERRTGLPAFNALFYAHDASKPGPWWVVSTYFDICLHRQLWFDTLACRHIRDADAARALLIDEPRTRYAILRPEEVARWFPDGRFDAAYRPAFSSDGFTLYVRQ